MTDQDDDNTITGVGLPLAPITRLFKETVPGQFGLSKEARIHLNLATVTYIHYMTAIAFEITNKAKKKTISASDMFAAHDSAGLSEFVPVLKQALEQYQSARIVKKTGTDKLPEPIKPVAVTEEEDEEEEIDIV